MTQSSGGSVMLGQMPQQQQQHDQQTQSIPQQQQQQQSQAVPGQQQQQQSANALSQQQAYYTPISDRLPTDNHITSVQGKCQVYCPPSQPALLLIIIHAELHFVIRPVYFYRYKMLIIQNIKVLNCCSFIEHH